MDGDYPLLIVDGPPGIGCPVISALSGADLTLVVAEPTASGVHDMQRILETAEHFRVPALVCVNKADLYPEGAAQIEAFCREHGLNVVGRIPFDETVGVAMKEGEPVTAFQSSAPAAEAMLQVWEAVSRQLVGMEPVHG
jgi:MinD superfamily P-loop ATPase